MPFLEQDGPQRNKNSKQPPRQLTDIKRDVMIKVIKGI